ncbi:MAG TPA: hypothetical protein EYP14_13495 [Planctomycetaceae bacterium]|nr:hypothetical protein [Planctomycetaceae bacterium]
MPSPQPERRRAAVLGEFGGLGLAIPGHTWSRESWGYRGMPSPEALTRRYVKLLRKVYQLKNDPGLSAAVYTQTTDLETECNGLITYDRAVIKPEVEPVAAANRGHFPPEPKIVTVVPCAQQQAVLWRYTTEKPPRDWMQPDFDDRAWRQGPGGFGRKGTPGAVVRTEWTTDHIWIRRSFELKTPPSDRLCLWIHHDEDAEVFLNGVLAAKIRGYCIEYEDREISPEALRTLKPGRNVMAIHCRQTRGGQYIDAGLIEFVPAEKKR